MADTGEPEAGPDADVELYKRLREAGRTELVWQRVETELFDYGWSVLLGWLRSGLIAQKFRQKGRPVGLPADWSTEDQEDVASVAVGDGLAMFGRAVEADQWHPSFGASLKTYFLGGCVLAFPNALRLWRRCREHGSVAELAKLAGAHREGVAPVEVIASVEAVEDLVRDEGERNQAIMKLVALDRGPGEMNDPHMRLVADPDRGARAVRLAGLERGGVGEPAPVVARELVAASSDIDLLAAHAAGDPNAFAALIERHRARMWAVALRTLRDPEEAADALQEALISAARRASSFRAGAQVTTWLHRIVVNACLDRVRRRQARPQVPLPDAGPDEPADPRDSIGERETQLVVQQALAELPDAQRAAIVLVDVQGYSVAEAAQVLGISEGTVKSRAARGRARLAKILGNER
jgi:RNA polymerase sigma-70 factor (ECF subfamily)